MSAKHTAQAVEHDLTQSGQQFMEEAKDKVTPLLSAVRDKVSTISDQLKDRAKDNAQIVDRYVRENPWSFVSLGIVTGFVIAWRLSQRSR